MSSKYRKLLEYLFGPTLWVAGYFYRSYSANRARLARFKAKEGVAKVMQFLAVAVFVAWIAIWLFASDESRTRLTEEVRQTLGYDFGLGGGDAAMDSEPASKEPAQD